LATELSRPFFKVLMANNVWKNSTFFSIKEIDVTTPMRFHESLPECNYQENTQQILMKIWWKETHIHY
jgi:hypothetical protein